MTHDSRESRLQSVLHAYLVAVDRGERPDRQAILDENPDLRDELAEYFADASRLDAMAKSLRTTSLGGERGEPIPIKVRYFGDYELLEEIARGGMGVVYKARQVSLNRVVALKMILKGQLASPADVQRFFREAEIAANLDHPNIVPIYEIGEHEGQQYFSMNLISLAPIDPSRVSPEPPRRVAARVAKAVRAVHYAHQRGVLHRDLKPSNVLIDQAGEPHVADFGLAKHVEGDDSVTKSGAIVGTPAYMAPEQARAEKSLTTAVDVYSLGAILYEGLTGRPPFRGDNPLSTLMKVQNDEPAKPRSLAPNVDRDLETICLKCLEKSPERRYASAEAFADDLDRWQLGEPIEARPVGQFERAVLWAKRNPLVTAMTLAVALAAVVSGYSAYSAIVEARAARRAERDAERRAIAEEEAKRMAQQETRRADAELNRTASLVYAATLAQAQIAFNEGNGAAALRHLEDCQKDLRGWEHRHLWTRFNAKQTLVGHAGKVTGAAYSPDGRRIVTCSEDTTAKVWDSATGKELFVLKGHQGPVTGVAFGPDGKRIATCSLDKTAKVWDAETGQELLTFRGHSDEILDIAFHPDGKRIATASRHADRSARVWETDTGKEVLVIGRLSYVVHGVAFSPNGKVLAVCCDDPTMSLFDTTTGEETVSLWDGHSHLVRGATFSPDGTRVVTASHDGTAIVWDAQTGKAIVTLKGHTSTVYCVAYSPDGTRIVTAGGDQTAKVWDAKTGRELFSLKGHLDDIYRVAFSPDSRRIVSASSDRTARVWDGERGQEVMTLKGHVWHALCGAISPDGKLVATGSDDGLIQMWDAITGKKTSTIKAHFRTTIGLAFSPDGKRLLSGSWGVIPGERYEDTAKIWDVATGNHLRTLDSGTGAIYGVAFSPDNKHVAIVNSEKTAKIWDADTGVIVRTLTGHTDWVNGVAYSPDGKRIVTGSHDRTARVWDAETGREILTLAGHTGEVAAVAFSPDGKRIATGSWDRTAKVWDAETGREVFTLTGHTAMVVGVAFTSDGARIATAGRDPTHFGKPGAAKIWNAANGREVLTLHGHTSGVTSVQFSQDARLLLTTSDDETAKLWEAETPR